MLTRVILCLAVAVVASRADEDRFESENKAKSVRPAVNGAPAKALENDAPKADAKELSADKVDDILAQKGKSLAVRGLVHKVYVPKSEKLVVLNFGKDHRSCFQVKIDAKNFEKFDGIDGIKKRYEGKTVVVEGTVSTYQKLPQIVVAVPSQIKVAK